MIGENNGPGTGFFMVFHDSGSKVGQICHLDPKYRRKCHFLATFHLWTLFGPFWDPLADEKGPANLAESELESSKLGPQIWTHFGPFFDTFRPLSGVATPEPSFFIKFGPEFHFFGHFSPRISLFGPFFDTFRPCLGPWRHMALLPCSSPCLGLLGHVLDQFWPLGAHLDLWDPLGTGFGDLLDPVWTSGTLLGPVLATWTLFGPVGP